jgi:predicted dehydrogenase
MAQKISIGIIGAGHNVREKHMPGLIALPDVTVAAVANSTRESSARFAAEYDVATVFDDWQQLIADPDIDAVIIGTWPNLHAEITCAALEAGKHVMCEARMAMDFAESVRMLDVSRLHPELVAQVVPTPVGLSIDRTIKRVLSEGFLGERFALDVFGSTRKFADPDRPLSSRDQQRLMGVNVMDLGMWYEASLRWWGHASTVFAQQKFSVETRIDPSTGASVKVDNPDHLSVLATYPDGTQSSITISRLSGVPAPVGAWLFGSEGTLRYDRAAETLAGARRGDTDLAGIELGDERGGWRVEAEFVGAIRGTEPITYTSFADGARYTAFTEAVRRSAATGELVHVDDID